MMIYVDANATYPVNPDHYDEVARILKEVDGNPSSIHASGRNAKIALEETRSEVATMFGCRISCVTFTSGATEGNNLVIQGVINKAAVDGRIPHVIVSAIEHSAVLEPVASLASRGLCTVDYAPVHKNGVVDVEKLLDLIKPETVLICVMHVNNEVGAINPIEEIAQKISEKNPGIHFHVDAVQIFGKADLAWYADSSISTAVVSGHKIGAFKGTGAVYLKTGTKLLPLISGGGQERARRPGTENIPGIVSLGIRCKEVRASDYKWMESAYDFADAWISELKAIPNIHFHFDTEDRSKWIGNTVNFHIEGIAGDDILLNFDLAGIQASSGSACSSGVARPSKVLLGMGYDEWVALNSVRTSFMASGNIEGVSGMIKVLKETIKRVSPPM